MAVYGVPLGCGVRRRDGLPADRECGLSKEGLSRLLDKLEGTPASVTNVYATLTRFADVRCRLYAVMFSIIHVIAFLYFRATQVTTL